MEKLYKIMFSVALFAAITVSMTACSSDDEEVRVANVLTDSNGVRVDLEWTTGGTTTVAKEEADLDLYLYKGNATEPLRSSDGLSFETVRFDPAWADDDYRIVVSRYSATKRATYTITINGISVTDQPYTFSSSFDAGQDEVSATVLSVKKEGSKYTVSTIN